MEKKSPLAVARARLMSEAEQDQLIRTYGDAIRPILESLLDKKAAELVIEYERAWSKSLASLAGNDDAAAIMLTPKEAAELVSIPVATVNRLRASGQDNEIGQRLLSHEQAATMLGCSVATIKRMVADGRLPEPVQISEKRIGHRIEDLKAFADAVPRKS